MATLREKRGGLMSGLSLLLLLFGGRAFAEDVGNGGLEGPKTAAVRSSAVATVQPRPPQRQRPPLPSSSGLKMQLTANPRTKDHRNGKSEYISSRADRFAMFAKVNS